MAAQPIRKYKKVPMNKSGTNLNLREGEVAMIMEFIFL